LRDRPFRAPVADLADGGDRERLDVLADDVVRPCCGGRLCWGRSFLSLILRWVSAGRGGSDWRCRCVAHRRGGCRGGPLLRFPSWLIGRCCPSGCGRAAGRASIFMRPSALAGAGAWAGRVAAQSRGGQHSQGPTSSPGWWKLLPPLLQSFTLSRSCLLPQRKSDLIREVLAQFPTPARR